MVLYGFDSLLYWLFEWLLGGSGMVNTFLEGHVFTHIIFVVLIWSHFLCAFSFLIIFLFYMYISKETENTAFLHKHVFQKNCEW